jgi:hypothetical protein
MKWTDDLPDDWDAVDDVEQVVDEEDEEIVTENLMNGIVLREEDDADVYVYARDEDLLHDADADVDHRRRDE